MTKRREYSPESAAKLSLATLANIYGRLPPEARNNPLVELQVMTIANSAATKWSTKVGAIHNVWNDLAAKHNVKGTAAALLRIMLASTLKYIKRPHGGVVPCCDVEDHVTGIAEKAGMLNQLQDVIPDIVGYVKNAGWCTEAPAANA